MIHPSAPQAHAEDERAHSRGQAAKKSNLMVPIRALGENHRTRIAAHLKALDGRDRYLRFGYAASDAQIDTYVTGLDFDRDEIFGIFNRHLHLIALAHLAYPAEGGARRSAEFGVSVLARSRGRGYGARLFERSAMNARNQGVRTMAIQMLSENTAMLRIARHFGATVVQDGAESQGYLQLPPATFSSRLAESIKERLAQVNYGLKTHAKRLRERIGRWQTAFRTVRSGG